MNKAPLNPQLEANPLVQRAWREAQACASLDELQERKAAFPIEEISLQPISVPPTTTKQKNPIVVLGKAPAATEIEKGEAYAGPAGQVLRRAFKNAGQDISRFHLTYASPWRARKANTPNAIQLAVSRPYLEQELKILAPRRIIVLGAKASDTLFGSHPELDDTTEHRTTWEGFEVVIIRNNGYILRAPHLEPEYASIIARNGY